MRSPISSPRAGDRAVHVVGIGGDPIIGSSFLDILELFQKDRQTKAVVLIGEIGALMKRGC
jgi:succinyl-CoA synthetase alpha subunit